MKSILNITNQLLAYNDPMITDNPQQRSFDFSRKLYSLEVNKPQSNIIVLAPNTSYTIYDGTISTGLDGTSQLTVTRLSSNDSVYRLSVTGSVSFKTLRAVSGITTCNVTINNNAVAEFNFVGANLSSVQAGDIMRIKSVDLYDTSPFAFNPLNSGFWRVVGVNGSVVTAIRDGDFVGINENITTSVASDVIFYADDGVQTNDYMSITGTLNVVSRKIYQVLNATPNTIDFIATTPIPVESNVPYVSNTLIIYKSAKKLIYIETTQDAVVRFNDDTSDNNIITPVQVGDESLPSFISKWGLTYKCIIVNKSISPMTVRYFMCE